MKKIVLKNIGWVFGIMFLSLYAPLIASATSGYTMTGAGDATANGDYCPTGGMNDGQPVYTNGTQFLFKWVNGGTSYSSVYTSVVADNTGTTNYFLSPYPGGSLAGTYTANFIAPDGTLTAMSSCGSPPPPPATDTATSTIEQYQINLFHGFVLFYVVFFGIVAFFLIKFK